MESRRNDTFFYTLIAQATTNFPGSKSVSFIDNRPGSAMVIGHDGKINFTFEHHPSWSLCSVDQQVPLEVAIRHLRSLIEPYQLEIHKVVSYEGWQSM